MNVLIVVVAIGSGVAVQLAAVGRLRRNGVLGIRTASVRRDDSSWTVGHRAAVLPTWATVGVTVGLEVPALLVEDYELAVVLSWLGVAVLFLGSLVAVLVAGRAVASRPRTFGRH